jgi:hypothetical protein
MRLTDKERQFIKKAFYETFQDGKIISLGVESMTQKEAEILF